MSGGAKKLLHAAAGTAASGDPVYVEDVFSTYLYTGNNANNHEINNGVDLSDGGLVWFKKRNATGDHWLVDSERGGTLALRSNSNVANYSQTGAYSFIQSFDDDGFTMGDQGDINNSSDFASWSFRKQAGFFDCVKFSTTGGGGTQAISHNLGSIPGYIVFKKTSAAQTWITYHKGVTSPNSNWWRNFAGWEADAQFYDFGDDTGINSAPTDTTVTLGTYFTNATADYVAYFFAEGGSGDQIFGDDGDEAIIKCGTYSSATAINLGFEPQWLMAKRTSGSGNWYMINNMTGFFGNSKNTQRLIADLSNGESDDQVASVTSTGFNSRLFDGAGDYMYVAIRRGPMKEPSAGTDVYIQYENNPSSVEDPFFQSSFPVDVGIFHRRTNDEGNYLTARMLGLKDLNTTTTGALGNNTNAKFDYMNGWYDTGGAQYSGYSSLMFRRYPKVFDVVFYEGNGSPSVGVRNGLAHNLGVAPEMIIHKRLDSTSEWQVGATPVSKGGYLNLTNSFPTSFTPANEFTATTFDVDGWIGENHNNTSGGTYLCLLFASLSGISKVGTYTGTGNNLNVDCGFSGGARFILIKRTDAVADWYVYDSVVQGIIAGNDPYWLMNTAAAEVTNTDYIDPLASGFTVTSSAPAALNASGGTYLFLAYA